MIFKLIRKYSLLLMILTSSFLAWAIIEIGLDPDSDMARSSDFKLTISPADALGPKAYSNAKAYKLITYIFGTMDTSSIVCADPSCSSLMGTLFSMFNSGLLVIAALFLSYVIVATSFSEANDGTSLSQKYASSIIPLRSALGLGFLVPTSTGYSLLQIFVVKIALYGSSAANTMWHYLLDYHNMTGLPIGRESLYDQSSSIPGTLWTSQQIVTDMNQIAVCNAYMNVLGANGGRSKQFASKSGPPDSAFFTAYWEKDWEKDSNKMVTYLKTAPYDASSETYVPGFNNTCGEMSLSEGSEELSPALANMMFTYMNAITSVAENFVKTFVNAGSPLAIETEATNNYKEQYILIANQLESDLQSYFYGQTKSSSEGNSNDTEWLDIPANFFSLLKEAATKGTAVNLTSNLTTKTAMMEQTVDYDNLNDNIDATCNFYSAEPKRSSGSMSITFAGSPGATAEMNRQLESMENEVAKNDALLGLSTIGTYWLKLALDLLIAGFSVGLIVTTITGVASDYLNIEWFGIFTSFVGIILTIFQSMAMLIPIATVFAIGLPMMPLIMFTGAISTWLVQTIVVVVGAPMIALGLIAPGPGLGKAEPALLLILNLFLRPSLNILGLVAGAKLFNIGFLFFTNAFVSTVNDSFYIMNVDSTSLMSIASIMFLFAYTFMISALCSRCYALIYLLPDRVLTWIGAPALPSQEIQAILQASRRNLQQAAQTGMEAGTKLMEGITEQFQSASETARDNKEEKKEREKDLLGLLAQSVGLDKESKEIRTQSIGEVKEQLKQIKEKQGKAALPDPTTPIANKVALSEFDKKDLETLQKIAADQLKDPEDKALLDKLQALPNNDYKKETFTTQQVERLKSLLSGEPEVERLKSLLSGEPELANRVRDAVLSKNEEKLLKDTNSPVKLALFQAASGLYYRFSAPIEYALSTLQAAATRNNPEGAEQIRADRDAKYQERTEQLTTAKKLQAFANDSIQQAVTKTAVDTASTVSRGVSSIAKQAYDKAGGDFLDSKLAPVIEKIDSKLVTPISKGMTYAADKAIYAIRNMSVEPGADFGATIEQRAVMAAARNLAWAGERVGSIKLGTTTVGTVAAQGGALIAAGVASPYVLGSKASAYVAHSRVGQAITSGMTVAATVADYPVKGISYMGSTVSKGYSNVASTVSRGITSGIENTSLWFSDRYGSMVAGAYSFVSRNK
ncbi:hypothetical protein EBR43_00795 [bacterium]|nr:hypothetical protein [bacterium]NBX71991.1 hypothetical protein [bacterium]